jgi:ribosome biogenesis GTPase
MVITVFRGGCEVVSGDRVVELRLVGRHAKSEVELAVGDEVTFDPDRGIVLDLLPRRTALARLRPRDDPRQEQVIAANMDRLAVVASVVEPPFRYGVVDRLLLTADAGGLQAILVVNKVDLLQGSPLPEAALAFEEAVPVFAVSAKTGQGLEALRASLARSRTVLAGHSGVGKSSLLNALEPELRLETGALRRKGGRGRHVTTSSILLRLPDGAEVIDTPGLREVAPPRLDVASIDRIYRDVARVAEGCRFRDCRHGEEPDCAVREAAGLGGLHPARYAGYRKLIAEISR